MFSNDILPILPQKNPIKYECKLCYFFTCNKKDYTRHINTLKHMKQSNQSSAIQKTQDQERSYICDCGKIYKDNSGLWRHKKKCNNSENEMKIEEKINQTDQPITANLILELIKDNKDIKQIISSLMSDQSNTINNIVKNGITNTINNTNCNNKTFNLQVFLNETCKDAMNITDFVDSIKLQLSDLIEVGELGYVEGISKIIIKNLNALDETIRPVHCTDKKRETIYIKDEGQWEKEDDNKSKLKKSIKKIADKNIKLLPQFREKYPECRLADSNISDKYCKMVIEAMGGLGDNNSEKENKIIKNISKNVVIDK